MDYNRIFSKIVCLFFSNRIIIEFLGYCTYVPAYKSMVNSRVKCLAITQVIRAKSYNSCLIFVFKNFFNYYVMACLTFSFILFLTCIFIWVYKCLCFRAKLGSRTRAKLSSLFSLLSS